MKTTDLNIEDLLPHRDRLKLVERILEMEDDAAATLAVTSPEWPAAGPGGVDAVMMIELAAQTAAVCVGGRRRREGRTKRTLGWIVGIKEADFLTDCVPFRTVLQTRVRLLYRLESYSVFEGSVEAGGDVLARIQLQVFGEEQDEEAHG